MTIFFRFVLSGLLLLTANGLWANGRTPVIGATPAWVKPVTVNYEATGLNDEAQDGYVDLHFEKQVDLARQSVFIRKAAHILLESGLQTLSQIEVDYDPSYQQLIFHSVRVVRGQQSINQLRAADIQTIRQEKELDRSIYNGELTAFLILQDLRKDDILEYSYTLKGFNPIFKNRYAETFSTQYDVPLYGLYYRLAVPNGRNVTVANSLTDVKPVVSRTGSETVYEWSLQNQHPVEVEKGLPSWHDAYPMIMVSEYAGWKEVVDWAQELFSFTTPLSPAMQKKVDEIKTQRSTDEGRVLAALRFVQDEVRYLGIEMGESSHRPHAASQVFAQRFGDCKDKAYLLCTLLRAMNIEAYPVLINTAYKHTITTWLPSPTAFDHTTACVVLKGKTYWFDATAGYQRGSLEDISFPDFQTGLVIKPGTGSFTTIPLQNNGKTSVQEAFYIAGLSEPARLVVTTQFSGSFADDVRSNYRSKSIKEIQGDYKKFYNVYFKKLDADSLRFEDNESSGVFTTKEYYTVRDFWKEEDGKKTVSLHAYLINSIIRKPDEDERKMPYALFHPARFEEEIEIHLPTEWPITEASKRFRTAAFKFGYDFTQLRKDVVLLHYNYENLKDHVLPNELSSYLSEWQDAEETMAFNLTDEFSDEPRLKKSGVPMNRDDKFSLAYILLGVCALLTFFYRRSLRQQRS